MDGPAASISSDVVIIIASAITVSDRKDSLTLLLEK
jgi:hypothetical protein